MQHKQEFIGRGGTVTLHYNGAQYSVDSEIEQAPGIFKCSYKPFGNLAAAQKYYDKCVKGLQNKQVAAACGIFQKEH